MTVSKDENWYAPGKVRTHKMTKKEREEYEKERKKRQKMTWREDRKCKYDLDAHAVENQNSIFRRTAKLRKR